MSATPAARSAVDDRDPGGLLYALIPVTWITALSLKTPEQVGDGKFFSGFSFDNYDVVFKDDTFIAALINSIGIAAIATIISIVLAAMAPTPSRGSTSRARP